MKLFNPTLILFGATAVSAFPYASSVPVVGAERAELERRHAEHMEIQSNLEKRQAFIFQMSVGAFVAFLTATDSASTIVSDIANAMTAAFGGQETPWSTGDNCLVNFSTHGGEECKLNTIPAAKSGNATDASNDHTDADWNVCPWADPANTSPPVQYFTDAGIGYYSVQFTATDTVAWSGIPNTQTCVAEGLCNPQLVFYRDGYNIQLNTWESQGSVSAGQYSGNFNGLCGNGPVKDQFQSNGVVMGFDCGIPCWNDADLPGTTV